MHPLTAKQHLTIKIRDYAPDIKLKFLDFKCHGTSVLQLSFRCRYKITRRFSSPLQRLGSIDLLSQYIFSILCYCCCCCSVTLAIRSVCCRCSYSRLSQLDLPLSLTSFRACLLIASMPHGHAPLLLLSPLTLTSPVVCLSPTVCLPSGAHKSSLSSPPHSPSLLRSIGGGSLPPSPRAAGPNGFRDIMGRGGGCLGGDRIYPPGILGLTGGERKTVSRTVGPASGEWVNPPGILGVTGGEPGAGRLRKGSAVSTEGRRVCTGLRGLALAVEC